VRYGCRWGAYSYKGDVLDVVVSGHCRGDDLRLGCEVSSGLYLFGLEATRCHIMRIQ
jgi:hypothetical protein